MTVYSGVISKQQVVASKTEHPSVFRFNLVLAVAALIMLIAYIALANFLVSQKYVVTARKAEINRLSASVGAHSQELIDNDLEALLLFAQKSGMVETKDASHILEEGSFALTPR